MKTVLIRSCVLFDLQDSIRKEGSRKLSRKLSVGVRYSQSSSKVQSLVLGFCTVIHSHYSCSRVTENLEKLTGKTYNEDLFLASHQSEIFPS